MAPRTAALMEMEELVEEFLLRLPLDDPASLVRAALVCKLWRRILARRGFRRRFRDFHRTPRLLGVIYCLRIAGPFFAPTSAFRRRDAGAPRSWVVHDSHHGRVLSVHPWEPVEMAVGDLIRGETLRLPTLQLPQDPSGTIHIFGWNAAVLCASSWNSSSDHLDCDDRHFMVVFISSCPHHGVYVVVYSSEAASWTLTASAPRHPFANFIIDYNGPSTLAGNALHVIAKGKRKMRICKYSLDTQEISWIKLPPSCSDQLSHQIVLTSTQFGGLGCAGLENSRLHLWSRESGSDGVLEWAPTRVIELETMLPSDTHLTSLAAFVHGVGVFLVTTVDGLFSIDLDSDRVTKVCEGREINNVVPYMSFCSQHWVRPLQERSQVGPSA